MTTPPVAARTRPLLHPGFISAGAALLIAAFVSDAIYYKNSIWQWANLSAWLIVFGLVVALVAAIALVIDSVTGRAGRLDQLQFVLVAAAALLSLLNAFVHSRDAWTSVVPLGISLSAVVAVLLLVAGMRGWRVTSERASRTDAVQ
jgi:uncharacterized membrane protein